MDASDCAAACGDPAQVAVCRHDPGSSDATGKCECHSRCSRNKDCPAEECRVIQYNLNGATGPDVPEPFCNQRAKVCDCRGGTLGR